MGPTGRRATTIDRPCAACRMLHRKCVEECLLAPYFPANEPEKFAGVHKVFGASNVIKMLQLVEAPKREDAVKSMVYEAQARLRDPVYGCAGAISYLQKHILDLKVQLEMVEVRVLESRERLDRLLGGLMEASIDNFNMCPMCDDTFFGGKDDLCNSMHDDQLELISVDYHHIL
ncbi:LOB domain-containing protein 4 [Acorus calamus]|uniref:LOB domain-containing protein 4 n=1 Tax=Acorus calamus TaxID=4465 RepID=A0AAV9CD59_ACOCL|nr:LOB domain-containing protein 4 [Acorus calamus]